MKLKAYASILAMLFLICLMGCSSSSKSTPPPVETIAPTGGNGQSATVTTAIGTLQATVTTGGSPTSGATVTFTAPTTGPTGTFANGTTTDTETTNASGVAISTLFTANGTPGPYSVAVSTTGASPATFSLTNTGGVYSFYLSGLDFLNGAPDFYALAGSVIIDASGNVVSGEQDYNDGNGFTSPEPSGDTIMAGSGALSVDTSDQGLLGQGTLTLTTSNTNLGASGVETLGIQFVNNNHALIVQFDGSATSSGSLDLQTLPSTLGGSYAFTLSGADSTNYASIVYGGVFTLGTGGTTLRGVYDENDAGTVTPGTAFPSSGVAISTPDLYGRGTITGTNFADLGASDTTLVYYIVGPEALRIIDVDASDSAVGSAFGQGTGTFSSAPFGTACAPPNATELCSAFGIESNSDGLPYAAAGTIMVSSSGTFGGVADDDEVGQPVSASPISGTYSIAANGYGSLTITPTTPPQLGDVSALGIYMTDPNLNLLDPNNADSGLGGALIADLDESLVGTGVLIPQATAIFDGIYAFGAQEYNPDGEFDVAGQGTVSSDALAGTGLVSDPFDVLGAGTLDFEIPFSGTATADTVNPGRYIFPLTINGATTPLNVVMYQAGGGQLFWLDEDNDSLFLGSLQQQGSVSGLPQASLRRAAAKAKKNKH